jgi:hypothetical protein
VASAPGGPTPPLNGAIRLSVGDIDFLGLYVWPGGGISSSIGVNELVAASLLRRREMEYFKRRRFLIIADGERIVNCTGLVNRRLASVCRLPFRSRRYGFRLRLPAHQWKSA